MLEQPLFALLAFLLVSVFACAAVAAQESASQASGIAAVWAVNDGEKVKRDDRSHPNKAKNSAWDGARITLFGARNEIIGFQVIVESGAAGARDVDVSLDALTHRQSGKKLTALTPKADPTDTRGGQIERFTQHYLHIEKPSPGGWFYARPAAPKEPTGWVPDALVPPGAKSGRGGFPFALEPERNQGVWFDVYVPKDMPAGTYEGDVRVREAGKTVKEIPVSLRVFDFVLPDENHFNAMIFFDERAVLNRHGSTDEGLIARYHRLAKRHRVEFTHAYQANPPTPHMDRITGKAFTPEEGYTGPGQGIGYRIIPASFYGAREEWQGDRAWKTADTFVDWLDKTKPDAITFLYITDEPPPARFPFIREVAEKHHSNPGKGKKLPMFLTHAPHPDLDGAIDIWCTVTNQYDPEKAKEEAAKGRKWWVYNGYRPAAGTQLTEAPAIDPRVTPWASWKYGVSLWFYWFANQWRHNSQNLARGEQNVWMDPVTFNNDGAYNGDGVLIYPGQDAIYPDQDRGIAGPVSSIRLKNVRRGMQDYEYLYLAEKNGLEKEAREIADAAVPVAFRPAGRNAIAWSERGSDWDEKRLRLAELLEKKMGKKQ